jgi:segregation and condensation protein B
VSEERESLAEQAAAWIPPWDRAGHPPPDPGASGPAGNAIEGDALVDSAASQAGAANLVDAPGSAGAGSDPAGDLPAGSDVPPDGELDRPAEGATSDDPGPAALADGPGDSVPGDEPAGGVVETPGVSDMSPEPGQTAIEDSADSTATADIEPSKTDRAQAVPAAYLGLGSSEAAPSDVASAASRLALVDEEELRAALEAILLVVDEPVPEVVLAQIVEQPTDRVVAALEAIGAGYTEAGHGFELRRAAGGWRLYTRQRYAAYVERFVLDGQSARLSQAALETLAVVAYKQPVTRSRIAAIRGVNCDGVIRTLTTRGLVEECGTEPESGAYLYRTTTLFLEKLGLDSVAELPPLAPFLPDDIDAVADAGR